MNRSFAILILGSLATACTATVNTRNSPSNATENSLMQADRDFAVATHARGIDGWSSWTPAIQIRRLHASGSFSGCKKPRTLSGTGLATGGPPVLQARPVAPILQRERQFRPMLSRLTVGREYSDVCFLDSPYGEKV
jgi:hypothetical protein